MAFWLSRPACGLERSLPDAKEGPPPESSRRQQAKPFTGRAPRDGVMDAQPIAAREQAATGAVPVAVPAVADLGRHHASEPMPGRFVAHDRA